MSITCRWPVLQRAPMLESHPYSSHDGILTYLGHRHDWEGITVVWQRDPEGDWWHRAVSRSIHPFEASVTDSKRRRPYTTCIATITGTSGIHFAPWTCMNSAGLQSCSRRLTPG